MSTGYRKGYVQSKLAAVRWDRVMMSFCMAEQYTRALHDLGNSRLGIRSSLRSLLTLTVL